MSRRKRVLRRLPLLLWLTLVWVMLWGTLDAGTVFFGLIVALLVTAVFPMPPITTNIVVRPHRLAHLVLYLAWDLLISTARVAWQAVRYGPNAKAGIVAVTMLTDSDHLTAMVANGVSLAPGKFVMQIDRANRICYVYALGMGEHDAESVRRDVLSLEAKVVRAVGSPAEVAMVEAHPKAEG
ncbi:multisubunit sodium/proton antiporter MrpE subunit [Saccharopolyspora erythraea NRRL 2338]|uniref:Multisubunit sodium/proton antiporter MrpE subunit n=1 Tax=Saccharopolyspora erythraea TaxID=1836 RepID=A0ABN1D615_SACER|nr:Na+/H+ antiporter subunit E [Saccharopolyspora erythraea]PFG99349.1 multisubunit sodium/proton antiporter MrpE subunit [Saccharopolyspora erythraea NRRL 2338]QRK89276.1 Na+/H+ antiporter subunit E [Saccharopolyspora erythraea]